MTNFERLIAFHTAVYGSVPRGPTRPDDRTLQLRETLIREEFEETVAALARLRHDGGVAALSEAAQELTDLLYVTYGTLVDLGVDADAVFAEVHRANMAKLSGPKRADGKQLKPEGWQPADVRGVLERQGGDQHTG
jgi:predicted HAD superfamily Cof-like phosphohydrolase